MPDTPQRMSRVDTAWLRMDNDVNLMMIVGVWLLQPGITRAALCERIEDKLLKYERFRQKVVQDAMGASWVLDPEFDVDRHVLSEKLAHHKGQTERQALQAHVGELANTPLDPDHPLWQFHLIDDYEGGSALVVRIHHCIGDGIALISVMLAITDGGMDPPKRKQREPADPDPGFQCRGLGPRHRCRHGCAVRHVGVVPGVLDDHGGGGRGVVHTLCDSERHPLSARQGHVDIRHDLLVPQRQSRGLRRRTAARSRRPSGPQRAGAHLGGTRQGRFTQLAHRLARRAFRASCDSTLRCSWKWPWCWIRSR